MCGLACELKEELEKNNIDAMGSLLDKNWQLKKTLAAGISNPLIDENIYGCNERWC
jgi:D-glycero-alpha-D-manno-heptose-7-phosphate kinase